MALTSAAAFGTVAILAKLAYAVGMSVPQLLSYRFGLATIGLAVLCRIYGENPLAISIRRLVLLATLGTFCYGAQTLLFFTALVYLPASIVGLLLYMYPTFVVIAGWLLLHRPIRIATVIALITSLCGVVLLTGGLRLVVVPALLLAFATPLAYTVYLLIVERATNGRSLLATSTTLLAGGTAFWVVAAAIRGQLGPPTGVNAWAILFALAIGPSVVAIPLVLKALAAIGSERFSLVSTFEPVVTVLLAVSILGERLQATQVVGAGLVLGAIIVLQWPRDNLRIRRDR